MTAQNSKVISPLTFTFILGATTFIYIGVVGPFTSGILTTIQREFQLKSSEVAFLFAINDIVGLVVITPIAYYGATRHQPRILGAMGIVFAVGCLLCALPQFTNHADRDIGSSVDVNASIPRGTFNVQEELCDVSDNSRTGDMMTETSNQGCSKEELAASGSQFNRATLFVIGQVFMGLGSSTFFTLGLTHLDDGVEKKTSTPVYIGGLFMVISLCPLFAFAVSGISLSIHTDFYKIDVDELGYGDDDPRWIGAWWLGYIIFAVVMFLSSIPYFFFPKVWPKKDQPMEMDEKGQSFIENGDDGTNTSAAFLIKPSLSSSNSTCLGLIKGYLSSLFRMTTNMTFMSVTLASVTDAAMFAGFFGFLGRYLQTQYDVTPSMTSIILGAVTAPTGLLGNLVGGVVIKRFKLDTKGIARFVIIVNFSTLVISSTFFAVSCPTSPIAGVNTPYSDGSGQMIGSHSQPSCFTECECPDGIYTPVCGADGLTYVTPCHAGCQEYGNSSLEKTYTMCSCIASTPNTSVVYSAVPSSQISSTDVTDIEVVYGTAVLEKCSTHCVAKEYAFLVLLALMLFMYSLSYVPGFMLFLRIVDEQDRAVGIAVSTLLSRVLGSIPAPIYFGAAIQSACLMFQESCGKTGNCLVFDNVMLSNMLFGLLTVLKCISFIMYTCSFFSLQPDEEGEYKSYNVCRSQENSEEVV